MGSADDFSKIILLVDRAGNLAKLVKVKQK